MSTHNLCFGAKIRKIGIPLHTPVFLYIKVGFKWVYITQTSFRYSRLEIKIFQFLVALFAAISNNNGSFCSDYVVTTAKVRKSKCKECHSNLYSHLPRFE